jgi:hypothetical protein
VPSCVVPWVAAPWPTLKPFEGKAGSVTWGEAVETQEGRTEERERRW